MKYAKLFALLAAFYFPCEGYSQKAIETIKKISDAVSPSQDTSKKATSGTQSNLAVSDAGSSADKSKTNSAKVENPIDKLKKKLTDQAIQNNNGTTGTQSNLAVSDAGSSADKDPKKRETAPAAQDTSKKTTAAPATTTPQ